MALAVKRRVGVGSSGSGNDVVRAMLTDNQRTLVGRLRAELAVFEARYEIRSDQVTTALAEGSLRDTEDVCNWVIAWETYRAASEAGPARLE